MRRLITSIVLAIAFITSLGLTHLAYADTGGDIKKGVCAVNGGNCPADPEKTASNTVRTIVNLLSAVAGVAAVIMIIIGGLRYTTSAGNADTAKSARNTIFYAVIGLVIVALAQLIVHFVLNNTNQATKTGSIFSNLTRLP